MKEIIGKYKKSILLITASILLLGIIIFFVYKYKLETISNKNVANIIENMEKESEKEEVKLTDNKAKVVSKISGPKNMIGITINGMADKSNMEKVLNLLDEYKIKAMFFLPTSRIAEEPDIAVEIVKRGHTIGNYTLTQRKNFEEMTINGMMKEFSKANEVLQSKVGITPQYFRCPNSKYSDQVLQVAANCNLSIAVPDFIKVNCNKIATADLAKKYASGLKPGNILSINLDNESDTLTGMNLLFKEISEKNYKLFSIQHLANKSNLLYNDGTEDGINDLDTDQEEEDNDISKGKKLEYAKTVNNYKIETLNKITKEKKEANTEKSEKTVKKEVAKNNSKIENIDYGELYKSPTKGSGRVFSYAYTTSKNVALTFDGLGSKEMVHGILDALDANRIKATFFLPGSSVEKDPELALEILKRGHEIENNTLNGSSMGNVEYQKACREIGESSKIIKDKLGITTKYVRPRFGKYNKDFCIAVANTGNELVTYSKNPLDKNMKSAEDIANYVKKEVRRGEIILLNADTNPEVIKAIPMIANIIKDIGYDFTTIDKLYNSQYKRLSLEEISGYDLIKRNGNLPDTLPRSISNLNEVRENMGKVVALTFDDWGTDKTVTSILNNLDRYNVKATFFIRSNGVVNNPNLAKAISEGGHDVASHTYSHLVINKSNASTLQNDLVIGHQALTYAIQRKPQMFFRPPQLEISDESLKQLKAVGYENIILADMSTHDWDPKLTKEQVINDVLTNSKSGSIIILHMLDDAQGFEVLPEIIEGLRRKGFTFVKLSDYIN
ncbi:polysaccharide deacetylase family protein [Clostridium sp. C2-6-12]|uniref:polysaccharide deacetylase family protein n=1 Tax=Clostridium sp. C2-6-12 TaxID=2698832 RepID=UPI001367C458|nr:polysaccharide deacetylase family protein [Clostridium sp. C2-6-12]